MSQSPTIDAGVDWRAPWLASVRQNGQWAAAQPDWCAALNVLARQARLTNHNRLPIQFAAKCQLPAGVAYEAHIHATGQVPTRDNLHDFFNALVWLTFPHIKARLNALQSEQIERSGVGKARGQTRDGATLFDENAALLAVTDNLAGHDLVRALRGHQWSRLFVQQRQQFNNLAEVVLFGHALMEKLVRPYKAITAHTLVCWVDERFHELPWPEKMAMLDRLVVRHLATQELFPGAFAPLPVLGVPGWWPEQNPEFYADTSVFRAGRQR